MEYINWLTAHWTEILTAITSVIAAASVIAKLTPTPADDAALAKVVKFVDFLALNTKRS